MDTKKIAVGLLLPSELLAYLDSTLVKSRTETVNQLIDLCKNSDGGGGIDSAIKPEKNAIKIHIGINVAQYKYLKANKIGSIAYTLYCLISQCHKKKLSLLS